MSLWKIIMLIVLSVLFIGCIVWFYMFKVFINRNGDKTVEEIAPELKRYFYILCEMGIKTTFIFLIVLI